MAKHNQYIEKIITLKNSISIFKDLDDDIIRTLVKDVRFLQYKMHESIINMGNDDLDIYILLNGECRVMLDNNKTVNLIKKNQVFGEFSPITNTPRSATVKANEDCAVLAFRLDFDFIDKQLSGYGVLYKNFVTELIKKLNLLNKETRKGTI